MRNRRPVLADLDWVAVEGHISKIPVLPYGASQSLVKLYVKWLATSPWEYHLDDSPRDMFAWTMPEKVLMQHNHEVMWDAFERSGDLWDYYAKHHPHLKTEEEN